MTPIAQTPDTDFNQHVKREHVSLETRELIHQFRNSAVAVPRVKEERAIDLMYELLRPPELHLKAADGYKKTGATVALDGSEDWMICREAGDLWRELNMRTIIDKEVAAVWAEVV